MHYQTKPVKAEAIQITQKVIEGHVLMGETLPLGLYLVAYSCNKDKGTVGNWTMRVGKKRVELNDWVVLPQGGTLEIVKPDAFAAIYEPCAE